MERPLSPKPSSGAATAAPADPGLQPGEPPLPADPGPQPGEPPLPAGLGRPRGEPPLPSPNETNALAWAAIAESSQRKRCAGARGLGAFLRGPAADFVTPRGDERTNAIDQGARQTYALGDPQWQALFRHLEACRLEGSTTHFSERQGTPAAPASGLMLDYDLVITDPAPAMQDRHYFRIASSLFAALQRDVDFTPAAVARPAPPGSPGGGLEARFHIFFIVRPEATPLPLPPAPAPGGPPAAGESGSEPRGGSAGAAAPALYKFGFHALVPGARLGRAYKKWLLRSFREDPGVLSALRELGVAGDPAACLDQNSASVPVLFLGSCKRGGVPYTLGAALEVIVDLGCPGSPGGWTPQPIIRRMAPAELAPYCLVAELSLTQDAAYPDGLAPLVVGRALGCRPEVEAAAADWGLRAARGVPAEELLLAEHGLATLALGDAEARNLHALLELLDGPWLVERNRWRDVVYALAGSSPSYKPLAVWFSHRCRHRSHGGSRVDELDALWEEALARAGAPDRAPLTAASINHWARAADPDRYAEVMERSYFTMLTGYVYEHGGRLAHYMIAKVLRAMLGAKFVVDVEEAGARRCYVWHEFVAAGQPMCAGEVWKWRREAEPDALHVYISESLSRVLDQIADHIEERRTGAADEDQARYYKALGKTFAASRTGLHNDAFKNGVVRQANYLFRRRGFHALLDRHPGLLGVGNGVLALGPRCALIDHYHEFPVSRFTPVHFKPFDPADPFTRIFLDAVADIIPEPDARDWILFHACQGLSPEEKEGLALFWEGGGQNGKTTFLRCVAKALGPYADKFNIQLLSSDREDADRPNSAMMRFKWINYAYSEETNKAQTLNSARLKELVNAGEVSGRDLNSRQETFTVRANIVCASQFSFIIDTTDHGTWRRLNHYTSKTRFRRNPNPASRFEKKEDQRFVRRYPNDPQFQASVLSVLVHYYERLHSEFGGELKNVPSPTIARETEVFRVSQDALHRWICETVLVSPSAGLEYGLAQLSSAYSEWYSNNIERKHHVAAEIIKDIESSALGKYLRPAPNGTLVLQGCRLLTPDAKTPLPGEELVSIVEMRGARTDAEWAAACTSVRADGLPWWAAARPPGGPESGAGPGPAPEPPFDDELWAVGSDDAAVIAAGRAKPAREAPAAVADADVETLLETFQAIPAPRAGPRQAFDLDDVFA